MLMMFCQAQLDTSKSANQTKQQEVFFPFPAYTIKASIDSEFTFNKGITNNSLILCTDIKMFIFINN